MRLFFFAGHFAGRLLLCLCLPIIGFQAAHAQITQTIKGMVIDQSVQTPLVGATVELLATDTSRVAIRGVIANEDGQFYMQGVPIGRYCIRVRYVGYKENMLCNILLNAGKETQLNIGLQESVSAMETVVVTASGARDRQKPINELATVSTRSVSVEETQRYAAAVNDPARMVTAFAGVVTADDGNNRIAIRGNSPNGLLWRMEGVDIPNPNHFSDVGTSGGGISILSAQLLGDSDFSTGAFAAEYGNALSGVFDLKLRKGNNDKREFTLQAGVLGLDLATEGPIGKGERRGSYLVNYRYSTLSIIGKLGVPLFDAQTDFQDLSFHVWLPTAKYGSFSLFGMGGLSKQTALAKPDSILWDENPYKQYGSVFGANTGVLGLSHSKIWGNNTYLKTVISQTYTDNNFSNDIYRRNNYQLVRLDTDQFRQTNYNVNTQFNHKFNAKHLIRVGAYTQLSSFNLLQKDRVNIDAPLVTQLENKGQTQRINTYAQWQFRPSDLLTINTGVHVNYLTLNKSHSIEPRVGLRYQMLPKHNLSLGFGQHSQTQPIGTYFGLDENQRTVNRQLDMSKALHFVAGYEFTPTRYFRIRTEAYYQHLYNIPISTDPTNHYSLLNLVGGYDNQPLHNEGIGRNMGVELTVERALHNGLYALFSLSLFDAKYQASDNIWRNTRYNNRYANSFTAGKEWPWSRNNKNRAFGVNVRSTLMGGQFSSPIDLDASRLAQRTIYDETQAFTEQLPAYFRFDIGVRLRRNYTRTTTTLSFDIQNASNRANVFGRFYNPADDKIITATQTPLIPVLAYKIQF